MERRAVDRLDVLSGLRKALERDELVVHYQPIVDLETETVVAAEALMRWQRPGYGLVPPLDFIPFAEETGLIQPLGAWILKEACTPGARMAPRRRPAMTVGVNVSPGSSWIPSSRTSSAAPWPRPGSTRRAHAGGHRVVGDAEPRGDVPKLDRIVQSGVQLTLDDFGEGYSSLSHLQRLPVQGLKVARPFVKGLADPDADARLVRGIIELAHSLELNLVAEGIELTEQRDALKALGCLLGQGFLFARPLELPALRALLREQQRPAAVS